MGVYQTWILKCDICGYTEEKGTEYISVEYALEKDWKYSKDNDLLCDECSVESEV